MKRAVLELVYLALVGAACWSVTCWIGGTRPWYVYVVVGFTIGAVARRIFERSLYCTTLMKP